MEVAKDEETGRIYYESALCCSLERLASRGRRFCPVRHAVARGASGVTAWIGVLPADPIASGARTLGSSRAGGPRAAAAAATLRHCCIGAETEAQWRHCSLTSAFAKNARAPNAFDDSAGHGPMQAEPSNQCPPRVVRCERVLRKRTKSVLLVLDRITDPHNEAAAPPLRRSAGVQHLWTVAPPLQPVKKRPKRDTKSVAKGADGWSPAALDNVASCVGAASSQAGTSGARRTAIGAVELSGPRSPRGGDVVAGEGRRRADARPRRSSRRGARPRNDASDAACKRLLSPYPARIYVVAQSVRGDGARPVARRATGTRTSSATSFGTASSGT